MHTGLGFFDHMLDQLSKHSCVDMKIEIQGDVHIDALQRFGKALAAGNRPGVARLVEDLRERQARGNELLAAELERARARGLHGRLLALADAAEPEPEPEPGEALEA
jgi:hypothetical protein